MATGAEVTGDGKGGLTAAGTTGKAGAPPPAPPGKKPKKPGAPPPPMDAAAKAAHAEKLAKLDVPPGFKETMSPLFSKAAERLQGLADAVDKSKPLEIGEDGTMPPVPEEVWTEFEGIMQLLMTAANMYPAAAAAEDTAEGEDGETPPDAGAGTDPPADMQMRAQETAKALVAKVGAKMSKERLDKFSNALATLGSLLQELSAQPPAPAGAPPAAGGVLGKVGKSAGADDAALVALAGQVEKLVGVVKSQRTEITSLKKARGVGNGLPVEGEPSATPVAISWPLDMNDTRSQRGSVNKSESFFGDEDGK